MRGVGTTAAGRQTGLNSKHRKQEEGLYSRAAGDGWSMDGRLLGGNGHWGRQGVDSDYTDPTGLLLPADQVAQHPLGGGGRGDEDPSDGKGDQGSRYTNLRLFVKLDSAETKTSLKPEALLIKELYKA